MSLRPGQNPTTTHGDRKLFKTTKFTLFNPSHFQHLFDEYSKLIHDLPETSGFVIAVSPLFEHLLMFDRRSTVIVELYSHDKILAVHPTATAFANRARGCSMLFTPRWKDPQLDSRVSYRFLMPIWLTNCVSSCVPGQLIKYGTFASMKGLSMPQPRLRYEFIAWDLLILGCY